MAHEVVTVENVKRKLAKLFESSLKATVPNVPDVEPLVAASTGKFGDYQWYGNLCALWTFL